MMFLLNELSLHNQYKTESEFIKSLRIVLETRELLRTYHRTLYCGRKTLGNRVVMRSMPLRKIVGNLSDKNIQRTVFQWIDKDGPFWDDERLHSSEEYYSEGRNENIVTDTVLAEAAFRVLEKMETSIFSFSPSDYLFSPVIINRHCDSTAVINLQISNYWQIQFLGDLLAKLETPVQSWIQLIEYANSHFTNLTFLPSFEVRLRGQPFSTTIAEQAIRLLSIINELKNCFDDLGHRSRKGEELIESFFTGDRARFSDELSTNINRFSKELTFRKIDGTPILCSFHGKISHRYYRLHISWPVTKNDPLYVAYLGPKITKE